MRANRTLLLAAAIIGLAAPAQRAAPATMLGEGNVASYTRLAGEYYYGNGYYAHRPACPYRYYYACWSDPYGRPQCGCWPGIGFYLFRFYSG